MAAEPQRVLFDVSTRTFVKIVAAAAAVWLLWELWYVLLLVVIALVLVGTLNPMVVWLENRRVPRSAALVIIFIGMLALLALVSLVTLPPLISQLVDIMEKAPALQGKLAEQMR